MVCNKAIENRLPNSLQLMPLVTRAYIDVRCVSYDLGRLVRLNSFVLQVLLPASGHYNVVSPGYSAYIISHVERRGHKAFFSVSCQYRPFHRTKPPPEMHEDRRHKQRGRRASTRIMLTYGRLDVGCVPDWDMEHPDLKVMRNTNVNLGIFTRIAKTSFGTPTPAISVVLENRALYTSTQRNKNPTARTVESQCSTLAAQL